MKTNITNIKPRIIEVLKKNEVARAGIFGSYARGEEREDSDIDILVEFKGRKSLFDLVALQIILEKVLRKKVDILTYDALNHLLKKRILQEEVRII